MAFNILIVDDELDIRELVSGILEDNDYATEVAGGYVEAEQKIKQKCPNLVILDVWLGEGERDGLRLLELIKRDYAYVPVIMMSGHSTIETAVSALKKGAYDFIEKPFDSARLITSVEKAIEASKLQMENEELKVKAKVSDEILGKSQNITNIKQQIAKIAPLNGRCIILGPIGSDKESIAKEIHKQSPRDKSPFGILNCNAYSPRQLEIELFGAEINTFEKTTIKQGLLERVNGGTLFIDDLSSATMEFQLKVLKMLKEEHFCRIGSSARIALDIRLIAGVTPDIDSLVKEGQFSNELYCRMNANQIKILPLNSRREDIPFLLEHFMDQAAKVHNTTPKKFSQEALGILNSYSWPGDVCQLKNMVDWILTISISEKENKTMISIEDLPNEILEVKSEGARNMQFISSVSELSIREAKDVFEKEYLLEQLRRFKGNISQAAKFVGMERSALHRKLKSLNISDPKSFKLKD